MPLSVERYSATVVDNADPDQHGRIKVKSLELLGDNETELPDWIEPTADWGWFVVPDVGEEVEVEAVVEDNLKEETYGQAFLEAPRIRWRGKRFRADEGDAPAAVHEDFTSKNYGKRRGFSTPGGHVLMFDDTDGDRKVTLSWKKEDAEEYAFISFDQDGSFTASTPTGEYLYLNSPDGEVSIVDGTGNNISSNADGVKVIDTFNNSIELKDGVVTVLSNGDAIVQAGKNVTVEGGSDVTIKAAQNVKVDGTIGIEIGDGATSPAMKFTEWMAWAAAHTHPTSAPGAPTSPPLVPPTASIGSTVVKVK